MTTPEPHPTGPATSGPAGPNAGSTPASGRPTAPPPGAPADRPTTRRSSKGGAGRSIGLGLAAALLVFVTVVLVLFTMFNTQTVQISLVFGEVQAPLVLALLIAAALGGVLVALIGAVLRGRRAKG